MNKKVLIGIIIAIVVLAVVIGLVIGMSVNTNQPNATTTTMTTTTTTMMTTSTTTNQNNETSSYLLKTFSLTDEYGNAGTYTEVNAQYSAGETIELEATIKPGYNFVGWFINDECVSEDLKYNFTMQSNNIEIEARYNYYTVLTFSYSDEYEMAGTFTELKNKKISVGDQVTVEATVNKGYNFEGWFINDICVSEELTYSFVMKDKNVDLEARWSYYTVSVNSHTDEQGTAGTFTKKSNEKVSEGETVTLTATVADGYNFEGWYIDGVCVCSELTYQFVMKKTNKVINVEYSYYTITSTGNLTKGGWVYSITNEIGTCTNMLNQKVSAGDSIDLIATVGDGYTFLGWYIDGRCVTEELNYSYTMTKQNVTIEALYTYYTLSTVGLFDNGIALGDLNTNMGEYTEHNETKIRVGDIVTLKATPKEGYKFVGWENGIAYISTEEVFTFVMSAEDVNIGAIFEEE